jgi:integral membrane sensor domain MASE1
MSQVAFRSESPLPYFAFPALGWAGLRFGRRGATLAIAIAVGFAAWNTTHYQDQGDRRTLDGANHRDGALDAL